MPLVDPDRLSPRHRFAQPVTGPSYGLRFKALSIVLLVALAAYGARVLGAASQVSPALIAGAAVVGLLMAAWAVAIVFGTTTVDADGIRRSGFGGKQVRWEQIGRVRFLRVPLSPRLVVLPTAGPMRSFFAGNAALEQAFREIDELYRP